MSGIPTLIIIADVMFCILGGISVVAHLYNLNSIKSKTVGDGQHGTARWATKSEIRKTYRHIPFTPNKWRKQAADGETPTASRIVKRRLFKSKKKEQPEEALPQGIVVGCTGGKHNTTALVDTGSKMDDVVFEEFKGTGNMELVLDRKLSEKRVFPALDILKSGTRRDDLLLSKEEAEAVYLIRKATNGMKPDDAVEKILDMFARTRNNREFIQMIKKCLH